MKQISARRKSRKPSGTNGWLGVNTPVVTHKRRNKRQPKHGLNVR